MASCGKEEMASTSRDAVLEIIPTSMINVFSMFPLCASLTLCLMAFFNLMDTGVRASGFECSGRAGEQERSV